MNYGTSEGHEDYELRESINRYAARTQPDVPAYAAPSMYERTEMGYRNDECAMGETPMRKSSVQYNLDEVFQQLDRLNENIDFLGVRLSDVLSPSPSASCGTDDSVNANSNLGSKLNAVAYRLTEYNQRLRTLAESVDL